MRQYEQVQFSSLSAAAFPSVLCPTAETPAPAVPPEMYCRVTAEITTGMHSSERVRGREGGGAGSFYQQPLHNFRLLGRLLRRDFHIIPLPFQPLHLQSKV